jgi:hypothetical protein
VPCLLFRARTMFTFAAARRPPKQL